MYMASLLSASYKVSQDPLCIKGNVQYINVTKNGTQLHSFTVSYWFVLSLVTFLNIAIIYCHVPLRL